MFINICLNLGWPKSLFKFFHTSIQKPEQTFWSTQHLRQSCEIDINPCLIDEETETHRVSKSAMELMPEPRLLTPRPPLYLPPCVYVCDRLVISFNAVLCLVAQLYPILCNPMDYSPPGSSVLGDSPGKNTGVGSLSLLQGDFPTQESNQGLRHCRWILYQLSYQGSPKSNTIYPIFQNGYLNSCYLCLLSQAPNSDSYK